MDFTALINSIKPWLESFFVGLLTALATALVAYLTSAEPFNWKTLGAALAAAGLNYLTSKARYLKEKQTAAVITNAVNSATETGEPLGSALKREMGDS